MNRSFDENLSNNKYFKSILDENEKEIYEPDKEIQLKYEKIESLYNKIFEDINITKVKVWSF